MSAIIAFPLIFTTQFEITHDYYVNPVHLNRLVENRFKVLSRACTKVASSYYQSKEKTGKKRDGIEQTQHIHIYPPHVIRGITFHFSIHLKTMAENRRSNHLKKKISSEWATVKKCQLATEYFFSCHIRDLKFKLGRKEGSGLHKCTFCNVKKFVIEKEAKK